MQDSERRGRAIAASDYPLLVKRINEIRDTGSAIRLDLAAYLRGVIETPLPDLSEEVSRLRAAQPDIEAAIAALIDGSSVAYFDSRPHLRAVILDAPASANRDAPTDQLSRREAPEETIESVLGRVGFDDLSSPLSPDCLAQLLGSLAEVAASAKPIRRTAFREAAIEKLRVAGVRSPASAVDAALGDRREDSDCKQGRALEFDDPLPWPDAVDGGALLDEIASVFRKYVVLPKFGAELAGLWAMHTYAVQVAFDWSPRLAVTGPTKRCGKSRVLEVLSGLVYRPLVTENISPAGMFRIVEQSAPTLLIDEGDAFLRDNEDMRGLLNAGQRRGGTVVRVVGEDLEPRAFHVFSAVAIACIGELPDTVRDRAIVIPMRRRAAEEVVARLRLAAYREETAPLRRKMKRWISDHAEILKKSTPDLPQQLDDRAADGWEPLLAIADVVGGMWQVRAREAAVALSAGRAEADDSKGVLLLSDLRELFDQCAVEKLASEEIVTKLATLEERPWSEWGRLRKPLSAPQLAKLLKPFEIKPRNLRLSGGRVAKGYVRPDFKDAWGRYCGNPGRYPLHPPDASRGNASATASFGSGIDGSGTSQSRSGVAAEEGSTESVNGKPMPNGTGIGDEKLPWE